MCDHLHLHLVEDILVNLAFEFTSILIQLYSAFVPINIVYRCFTETQNLMAKQAAVAEKNSLLTVWNLNQDQAHMGDVSCWWAAGCMNIEWKEADMQMHIICDSLGLNYSPNGCW